MIDVTNIIYPLIVKKSAFVVIKYKNIVLVIDQMTRNKGSWAGSGVAFLNPNIINLT